MTATTLFVLIVTAVGIPFFALWLDRRFENNLVANNPDARLISYKEVMPFPVGNDRDCLCRDGCSWGAAG